MAKKSHWLLLLTLLIPLTVISAEAKKNMKAVRTTPNKPVWGPSLCSSAPKIRSVRSKSESEQIKCRKNLKKLGDKLAAYAAGHSGKYPDELKELECRSKFLNCPVKKKPYRYLPGLSGKSKPDTPVVYCTCHRRKKTQEYLSVLFVSGQTGQCTIDE